MSGFEIVGIVLGGFPLLVEGLKQLQDFLGDMKFYWTFQTSLEKFIADVDLEQHTYRQISDIILDLVGIHGADRDDLHNTRMTAGDEASIWHRPWLEEKFRQKLTSNAYEIIVRRLQDIDSALKQLCQLALTRTEVCLLLNCVGRITHSVYTDPNFQLIQLSPSR